VTPMSNSPTGAVGTAAMPECSPDEHAARALIMAEGARVCSEAAGGAARAIVLTGSMSRDEATFKKGSIGWQVLGDATFLIVLNRPVSLSMRALQQEIERRLLERAITCKVDLYTTLASAMRKIKPHIYAYELRKRGRVVWGDEQVLSLMRDFPPDAIPLEDGWWFVCNRMIEQLESATEAGTFEPDCAAVQYRIAKLYLAMAACYLLAVDSYEPSYRERSARLAQLAKCSHPPACPISLERFANFVSRCTELKLQGTVPCPDQLPHWREAATDTKALWRWMLASMTGSPPTLDCAHLLAALAAQQPLAARAKSWLRAIYTQRWSGARHWVSWSHLARGSSPRYLVYEAASDLFFAATTPADIEPEKLAAIAAKLPLPPAATGQPLSWRVVAKQVANNFRVLVASTRS
jgi:hypothetical protein